MMMIMVVVVVVVVVVTYLWWQTFVQLNGDLCYWIQNDRGDFELINVKHDAMGTAICTKAVGRGNRDVVDLR